MEIETEFIGENNFYQQPSILCDNYIKPFSENDFPIESLSPSNFLDHQYFNHFDHHNQLIFHANNNFHGSSQNPVFSSLTPYTRNINSSILAPSYEHHNYKHFDQLVLTKNSGEYLNNHMINNGFDSNIVLPNPNFELENMKPVKSNSFVLDQNGTISSCITAENGYYKRVVSTLNNNPLSNSSTKKKTCKGHNIKPNPVKGQWTGEEDRLLIEMVRQHGLKKWSNIAQMLPGRIGKQCRERWHNHLRPDIKKETWSEEEDKVLIEAHIEIGNKWAEIAKRLPGRTENSIKNHWNATKRRQNSKRKCRSKCPRPSLLQAYIKSLNLNTSSPTTRKTTSTTTRQFQRNMIDNVTKSPIMIVDDHHIDDNNNSIVFPSEYHDFGYDHDPDFGFGKNMMFQELGGGSIDSLFDDEYELMEKKDELMVDLPTEDYDHAVTLESSDDQEVMKKDMDLVEMISQVKNSNTQGF